MQSRRIRRYGLALFLILFFTNADRLALAQNPTFSLEGVVVDAQQAVLPGATVTVQNLSTGLTRTVTTDDGGRFVVRALPPEGRYRVQVEIAGFATEVREGLVFNAGQNVVLNFSLKLSSVQETVTVAGESPIVQTTSSEVTSTIDRTAFENLPVKERNYFRLLTLDSNVVARGTGSNAVNGGGGEVWNFGTYVDGTNNHSKWLTLQRAPQLGSSGFAIETVKEVQLITNQFSAEFGGHSAGVASMVTKSGANDVRGSAFVMIRPGDLDATPPLSPIGGLLALSVAASAAMLVDAQSRPSASAEAAADPASAKATAGKQAAAHPRVRVQTDLGDIVVEIDRARAPVTSANFMKYVDAGHYDGGMWHRTVKMDNQPESSIKIEVIQAGVNPEKARDGLPPIPLERTTVTGILHKDGVISMARGMPDSATSGWFICINDQPSLDFGGQRNPDGQGFGAFGRVVSGMDVVRKIHVAPSSTTRTTNTEAQRLTPPIKILKVAREAP